MSLSKTAKLLLIVATVAPPVYMVLFFVTFALMATAGQQNGFLFENFAVFMIIHILVMFLMFALIAFYLVFLFKTDAVRNEMKAFWAVVIFMGAPIAMPIFWYLYVWPGPAPGAAG
jgi:hypothetical protein